MRHKKYNKIVYVKERTYSTDELGDSQRLGLSEVAKAFASIVPMPGGKTVRYEGVDLEKLVEIKMHQPRTWTISKEYVITHGSVEYQILDFYPDERNRELTVEAKRYD